MGRIPSNMTEVLFISGHGTEYIQTDIHLDNECIVKSRWRFNNDAACVYGCFTSSAHTDNFCLYGGSHSSDSYIRFNGQLVRAFKPVSGTTYSFEHSVDGFFVDGTKITGFQPATFTCSAALRIFGLPNSRYEPISGRCYNFQILKKTTPAGDLLPEKTEVIYDFVPVKNEDTGEAGLYETVNGRFYGNSGTGAFVASTTIIERPIPGKISAFRRRLMEAACKHYEPEPGWDGYSWFYYDITNTTGSTQLTYDGRAIPDKKIFVDGVEVSVPNTSSGISYRFSTAGRHLVKIPLNTINASGYSWFYRIKNLKEAYFAGNVDKIGDNTFVSCTELDTLVLPDLMTSFKISSITATKLKNIYTKNVTTITGVLGAGNDTLERMEFPNVVTMSNILDNGNNTTVKLVDVGPSIQTITGTWLYHSGVETIVMRATTPPTAQYAVYGLQTNYKVYVPYSADHSILNAYKAASGWSNAASRTYELNPDGTIPV